MSPEKQNSQLSDIKNNLVPKFNTEYLPTNQSVLQRLLYETQTLKSKLSVAITTVINEILNIWEESSIDVKRIDKCQEKLKKLYNSYREVAKFQDESSQKVIDFCKIMNSVFDISKDDATKILSSIDDSTVSKGFLLKPVQFLKTKLSAIKTGKIPDEDNLGKDDVEMSNQSSPDKVIEPEGVNLQSSPRKLIEPELDVETLDHIPSEIIVEPEKELTQKLSQTALIDDHGADEDGNLIFEILTRSKANLLQQHQYSSEEICSSSQSQGSGIFFKTGGRNYESRNERGSINVMTPEIVAALDTANVSDRHAVFLIALLAHSMNVDLNSLILNRKSINAARSEIRKREYEKMKIFMKDVSVDYLTVHWDGKMISDDCKKIERLPILVSSNTFTRLVNVPALEDQKSRTVALAVYAALKEWGLIDHVNSLCCDTANVNLGAKGGAALILEELMNKDLLYLACRRHMLEILLRAAYEQKFPGTSGPDVPLFKRFRDEWPTFDLKSFENGLAKLDSSLKDEVPFVIKSIKNFLQEQQPRDDYKELLEICLIFLGDRDGITFKKPGAVHHARWMAKAVYSIKMFLFRKAFKLKKSDEDKLFAVCKFIVFVYLNPWYTAPLAISAPNNDLKLIKASINFKNIDKSISDAVLHKLRNHLWYLSPELSMLSLFDADVDITIKKKIVESLKNQPLDEEEIVKKFDPSDEGIRALGDKSIDYFTNNQSLKFFERFKLDKSFLKLNCTKWEGDPSYIQTREKLKQLVVVNDCAERAVHLAEEYLNTRSRDEDQKQYLLHFVNESRQNLLASSDKKQLLKKLKTEE